MIFFSSSFSRDFCAPLESFNRALEVVIVDDRLISASNVYRDCMLEIFGVGFPIDLILIPMRDYV